MPITLLTLQLSAGDRACESIFLPYNNKTAHKYLDFTINGAHSVNTDSMSIVQRINPYYSDILYVDSELTAKVSDQTKIKVIKNPEVHSDQMASVTANLETGNTFRFTLGQKYKHQPDSTKIRAKMAENLTLHATDAISLNARVTAPANMKVAMKVVGFLDSNKDPVYLNKPIFFESNYMELPTNETNRINFLWKNFTTKDGQVLSVHNYIIDEIFFEVTALQSETKNLTLYFDGPLYIEQFSSYNGITDDFAKRYWDNLGIEVRNETGKVQSRTTFLKGPIPLDFRKMIYNRLHDPELEREALQMLKNGKLQQHMEDLGFKYKNIDFKFISTNDQFKFFKYLIDLQIPIEIGTFGEYHGTQSHALQLYCITKGMTPDELSYFKLFYQEMGSNAAFGWTLWNSVFDYTRPDSPRSPLYWAQKVRELFPD